MNTAVRFRASSLAVLIGSVVTAQGGLIDFEGLSGGAPQSGGTYLTYSSPLTVGDYMFETPTRFSLPMDFGVWTDIADANTSFSNYTGSIVLFSNTAAPTTMTRSDGDCSTFRASISRTSTETRAHSRRLASPAI